MANVFTRLSHYPRYESLRSQCLPLQLQVFNSSKSKQDQLYEEMKNFSTTRFNYPQKQILSKDNQRSKCWSVSSTYATDYRPWSQSEMRAARGQSLVIHDQVAESSVPELPPLPMILKRYSLPNVELPIPIRCCCRHSKQWQDPCLKQTGINYWKNLSCCGIIHENELNQSESD
jgi:hypothetical protein